jgi:hypothetical protein
VLSEEAKVYVPGFLTVEAPDTLRWDINPESPFYASDFRGWQKGRFSLNIYGDAATTNGPKPVSDTSGISLDGEPIVPSGGVLSGDSKPGGTFTLSFRVDAEIQIKVTGEKI